MMIPAAGLLLVLVVVCCVHVVRSGREMYWLYLIILLQPIGAIVYLLAVILPEFWSGKGAVFGSKALKVIDPGRAYREAAAEVEASPTVYNRMKLAEAAEELGQFGEAAQIYALCLDGPYSDDPTLLLRYAHCLVEVEQYDKALAQLEKLGELGPEGRTPAAALLLGRANEGVGNLAAADIAFDWAAERLTGMEGLARYIAFLVHQGRRAEAEEKMAILEKRFRRVPRAFRREEAKWRAQANAALSGAVATQS